jgi:hypothetical protein
MLSQATSSASTWSSEVIETLWVHIPVAACNLAVGVAPLRLMPSCTRLALAGSITANCLDRRIETLVFFGLTSTSSPSGSTADTSAS